MKYLSTFEIGEKMEFVCKTCRNPFVPRAGLEGAMRAGKMWIIPEDAVKPADARYRDVEKVIVSEVSKNG